MIHHGFIPNALSRPNSRIRSNTAISVVLTMPKPMAMKTTKNHGAFIKFAILTSEPEVAKFRQRQAKMYADYHKSKAPIASFISVGKMALAKSTKSSVIIAVPLDNLQWTREIAAVINKVDSGIRKMKGIKDKQLWVSGAVSDMASKAIKKLGWSIHVKKG